MIKNNDFKIDPRNNCHICGSIDIGVMFTTNAIKELADALEELTKQPGMEEFFAKERLRELLSGDIQF